MLSREGFSRSTLDLKKGFPSYSMSPSLDSWWHGPQITAQGVPGTGF